LPAKSLALTVIEYCRPSMSFPFRDAWRETVKE
jgi:hypothetical protein